MSKVIDLRKTVYELVQEYPEVAGILADAGLKDIQNPTVLETVGRQFTIPQGTSQRGFALEPVVQALKDHGFEVVN